MSKLLKILIELAHDIDPDQFREAITQHPLTQRSVDNAGVGYLGLPIIELSYVHRIVYRNGIGNYHYEVSYLCQFNGDDALVVKTYPCTEDQLYSLPMITKETTIVSYNEDGTPTN